jgi:hypothetical protein
MLRLFLGKNKIINKKIILFVFVLIYLKSLIYVKKIELIYYLINIYEIETFNEWFLRKQRKNKLNTIPLIYSII